MHTGDALTDTLTRPPPLSLARRRRAKKICAPQARENSRGACSPAEHRLGRHRHRRLRLADDEEEQLHEHESRAVARRSADGTGEQGWVAGCGRQLQPDGRECDTLDDGLAYLWLVDRPEPPWLKDCRRGPRTGAGRHGGDADGLLHIQKTRNRERSKLEVR